MYNDIITLVFEKYIDDEFTYEQANELLVSLHNKYFDDYTLEGANRDYLKAFKAANKKFKESVKKLKKIAASGNPDAEEEFYDEMKNANKALDDGLAEISEIPSTVASSILSFIILDFIQFVKWLLPTILTLGIAQIVKFFQNLIVLLRGIGKGIRNEEDWVEALNMVRQKYSQTCEYNRRILSKLEERYKKNKQKKLASIEKKAEKAAKKENKKSDTEE